jgi:serine/threonine protein phosphatase 1
LFNVRIAAVRGVTGITKLLTRFKRGAPHYEFLQGVRIYAIGDVHGCHDLLERLEARIMHSARDCGLNAGVIFLGDYIDRGPDVAGVIEHLSRGDFAGLPTRYLMGNHEDILLEALEQPALMRDWLRWGGMATLASYRITLPTAADPAERDKILARSIRQALPAHHLAFLQGLELSVRLGDYLFVHAGVRPGRPMDRQSRYDMLTIREPFLSSTRALPCRVVHGHSVAFEAQSTPFRIGIDTGAYATGRLSAVMIEAGRTEIISVSRDQGVGG